MAGKAWAGIICHCLLLSITYEPSLAIRSESETKTWPMTSLLQVNPAPFIEAAKNFTLNADFDVKAMKNFSIDDKLDGWSLFSKMRNTLYEHSDSMMTAMALSDKILLSDMITNFPGSDPLSEDQVETLFSAQLADEGSLNATLEKVKDFVKKLETLRREEKPTAMYLKCSHLSEMRGNSVVREGESISAISEKLDKSVTECAELKAMARDTPAMQAIRSGIVMQRLFPVPPDGQLGHYQASCFRNVQFGDLYRKGKWHKDENGTWISEKGHVLKTIEKDGLRLDMQMSAFDFINQGKVMTQVWEPKKEDKGNAPIEVRVQTIWGKAHTGVYFPVPFDTNNPSNAWIVKNDDGKWETKFLHYSGIKSGTYCLPFEGEEREKLQSLFERLMPVMAKRAETFAQALGVPWLRVDFFVKPDIDCKEKCVTLNEVAQNSNVLYHDPDTQTPILIGEATRDASPKLVDLVKALVDGYRVRDVGALVKPAMEFFSDNFACKQNAKPANYAGLTCKSKAD